MPIQEMSFGSILAPIEFADFIQNYFEKQPLHVHRPNPSSCSRLPSLSDFESLIRQGLLRASEIRLAQRDAEVVQIASDGPVEALNVFERFDCGASLVFDRIERHFPVVQRLCREIEIELRHPVTANAVITPPQLSQGFDLHFDFQDVFVLQLHGHKRWLIYEPLVHLPLPEQFRFPLSRPEVGPPILEIVLGPGDFLYIPRGFPHEAQTQQFESLQIGLGLFAYTSTDVIAECIQLDAVRDERLREEAAVNFLGIESVADGVAGILKVWKSLDWSNAAAAVVEVENRWKKWAKACPAASDSPQVSFFESVESASFRKADPTLWRIENAGTQLTVSAPGFCWTRPTSDREVFEFLIGRDLFSLSDFPEDLEPTASKIIRSLVAVGAIIPSYPRRQGEQQ